MGLENIGKVWKSSKMTCFLAAMAAVLIAYGLCLMLSPEYAHADTVTSTNGKKVIEVKGNLINKKSAIFYRYKKVVKADSNSDKKTIGKTITAKNVFLTKGNKSYYFQSSGKMAKGWVKIKSDYYYFDRSNGMQIKGKKKKNVVVDGIKIKRDGKAIKSKYNVDKINTMIKARNIMLANTKYTDSRSTKRYKMFRWVMSGNYRQFRTLKSTRHRKGWELLFANDMFDRGKWGCCVSNACAFAFLAKECGYKDVNICDDTGHGFVMINGRYFDTLFAETNGFNNYYNASRSRAAKDFLVNSLRI